MESNNPQIPVQPVPEPAPAVPGQPVMPQVTQTPPEVTVASGGGGKSKMFMILGVVLLLLVVLGGGAYYYMTTMNSGPKETQTAGSSLDVSDLSSELQAEQPEDIFGDFTAIDADIESL